MEVLGCHGGGRIDLAISIERICCKCNHLPSYYSRYEAAVEKSMMCMDFIVTLGYFFCCASGFEYVNADPYFILQSVHSEVNEME